MLRCLIKAGEWFLLSKSFESFMNAIGYIAIAGVAILVAGWVFFQLSSMARMAGM